MTTIHAFIRKSQTLALLGVSVFVFALPAVSHAVVYAPGATLDPACAPGPACTVRLITAYDEGAPATTSASVFDFVGAGVTVTSSSTLPGAVQISIPGSSGASNWLFSGGSAITPSSTVGIIVNASSSISLLNAANFNLGTGTIQNLMIAAGTTTAQNGGFNLTGGGCYAVNGVCVGGGATSSNPMGSIQLADGTGKFTSTSSFSFATATNILSLGTPHESIRLFSTTSGSSFTGNLFLGDSAGNIANNNSGILNTGIGRATMSSISSGIWNTALGAFSQQSNSTGNFNTSVGVSALRFGASGDSNSAFGLFSLSANTGSNNVGIGANSLSTNTSGNNSVGIGNHALSQLSQATNTVAVGFQAGMSTVGNSNQGGTFIGYQAGRAVNTGADYNTFVGYQAGFDTTTGAGNLVLGDWQSSGVGVTTGSNNILIGSGVRNGLNQTGSNQLNIGNLLFGTGLSTNATASTGRIGIGTSTPGATLSLAGATGLLASTTATSTFQGGGINLTTAAGNTGCFAINGVCVESAANAWQLYGNANATSGSFMGTQGAFALKLFTNNTERVSIGTTTGYVGVGNTAPGAEVDVAGTVVASRFVKSAYKVVSPTSFFNSGTGAITTAVSTVSAGTSPRGIATDARGRYVYFTNQNSADISMYSIDQSNGALTSLGATIAAGTTPLGIVTDPSGRFVYVANFGSNTVSKYSINETTGLLTAIGVPTANAGAPTGVAVDPTGRFVYVTNNSSASVSSYSIDQVTGELTSLGATIAAGTNPVGVAVDPTGRFVYVTNSTSNNIFAYSINQTTGALTLISSLAAGAGARGVDVDPSGRFVYVANSTANTVSMYSVNQSSGALTSIAAPVAAGSGTIALTIDPNGRNVYVVNFTTNDVSMYIINQSSGALTSLGSTAPAGSGVRGIFIDPAGRFLFTANNTANTVSSYSISNFSNGAGIFTGSVGVGTSTPSSILAISGSTGIFASTTATSTFQGGGINLITSAGNTGCFAINGTCIGGSSSLDWSLYGNANATSGSYIGTQNAFALKLFTNNTERVSIGTTTGFVGIGTTSPTQQLSASGLLYVGGLGTSTIENNLNIRGTLQIGTSSLYMQAMTGYATINNSAGNSLVLQSSGGNVGIGTTTPTEAFSVIGNGLFSGQLAVGGLDGSVVNPNRYYNLDVNISPGADTVGDFIGIDIGDDSSVAGEQTNIINSAGAGNTFLNMLSSASILSNSGDADGSFMSGSFNQVQNLGAGDVNQMFGDWNIVENSGSGDIALFMGSRNLVTNSGTGNVLSMYGGTYSVSNDGVVDDMRSVYASADNNGTSNASTTLYEGIYQNSGTAQNITGLQLANWVNTGSVDESRALYIDNTTNMGTLLNYAIASDSTADSYLKGRLGIGTTSPTSILSLAGTSGIFASTTATSTFQGGGINLITSAGNTGCFAINGTCIGGSSSLDWSLYGNANATATSVMGTTNAFDLNIVSNGTLGGLAGAGALIIGNGQTGADTQIDIGNNSTSASSQTLNIGNGFTNAAGLQTLSLGQNVTANGQVVSIGTNMTATAGQFIQIGDSFVDSSGGAFQFLSFGDSFSGLGGSVQNIAVGSNFAGTPSDNQTLNIGSTVTVDGGTQTINIGANSSFINNGAQFITIGTLQPSYPLSTTIMNSPTVELNGALRMNPISLANFPAGGVIGASATTVDIGSMFSIFQTTAGQTLSLPAPSLGIAPGRFAYVVNTGSASFIMASTTIAAGESRAFIYSTTTGWALTGDGNGTNSWSLFGNANATSGSFMGTQGAFALNFFTNGAHRMTLGTTTGELALGTTSPVHTSAGSLSMGGLLYVGGTGTSTVQDNLNVQGQLQIGTSSLYLTSANGYGLINSSQNGLVLQGNGGAVAIGTTTDIYGNALTAGLTINNALVIASSTALSTTSNALYSVNGTLYWNGAPLSAGGSFSSLAVADLPAGGDIGTAAATVDIHTNFNVTQTTTGQNVTLPNPTDTVTTAGKIITINNTGTANFSMYGVQVPAGSYGSAFVWTGTAWNPLNAASNVAAEYGETPITSSSVSTTAFTDFSTNQTVTVPSAGTWEITYIVNGGNSVGNRQATLRVLDVTAGNSLVPNSVTAGQRGTDFQGSLMMQTFIVTTAGANTYKLQGAAQAGSSFNIYNDTVAANPTGSSKWVYRKISGNAPVTGQSVDYVNAKLTAFTVVANGAALPFVTQGGNIPNASGVFSLTAGKTYKLTGATLNGAGGTQFYQWRDITNNTLIGNGAANSATANTSSIAEAIITPSTDITVRLENTTGTAQNFGGTPGGGQSWATIVQLGSTAMTGVAMSFITDALANNSLDNTNFTQTWDWSTATTTTALAMSANSLTTGSLLNLTSSSANLNGGNGLVNIQATAATSSRIFSVGSSTAGNIFSLFANGIAGFGTTTPGLGALMGINGTIFVGTTTATTTATSTISHSLNVQGALQIGTSSIYLQSYGTSTFSGSIQAKSFTSTDTTSSSTLANGINLTGGCFAINSICIEGGAGQWATTSNNMIYYNDGNVGIGTSSSFYDAKLTVSIPVSQTFTTPSLIAGADAGGSTTGTMNLSGTAIAVQGNYAYVGYAGNTGACSATAGNTNGCEFKIFDISSTTNPVYMGGGDIGGTTNSGTVGVLTAVNEIVVYGNFAYIALDNTGVGCQVGVNVNGCAMQVWNISNPAAPTFVTAIHANGDTPNGNTSADGIDVELSADGKWVYLVTIGDTNPACNSAVDTPGEYEGCELKVFRSMEQGGVNIFAGYDFTGPNFLRSDLAGAGTGGGNFQAIKRSSNGALLYAGTNAAEEFMALSIVDPYNISVVGRYDLNNGSAPITDIEVEPTGTYAFTSSNTNGTICSNGVAAAVGCEINMLNVANTNAITNVAGFDAGGQRNTGTQAITVNGLSYNNGYLYAVRAGSATACSNTAGAQGCEIMVFGATSTSPFYLMGFDATGASASGTGNLNQSAVASNGSYVFVAGNGNATACSGVAGSALGCELKVFNVSSDAVLSSGYALSVIGRAIGTSWESFSDRNLKENIVSLASTSFGSSTGTSLAKILGLNPTQYNFIGDSRTRFGFIAQEVQTVMPELVSENNGLLSMDYMGLIAPTIGALQELNNKIFASTSTSTLASSSLIGMQEWSLLSLESQVDILASTTVDSLIKIETLSSTTNSLTARVDAIDLLLASTTHIVTTLNASTTALFEELITVNGATTTTVIDESGISTTEDTFLGKFFKAIIAWFGEAGNGIESLFAKKIRTEELCLPKSDGTEVCINGDQVDSLLGSPLEALYDLGEDTPEGDDTSTTTPDGDTSGDTPAEETPAGDTTGTGDSSTPEETPPSTETPTDSGEEATETPPADDSGSGDAPSTEPAP